MDETTKRIVSEVTESLLGVLGSGSDSGATRGAFVLAEGIVEHSRVDRDGGVVAAFAVLNLLVHVVREAAGGSVSWGLLARVREETALVLLDLDNNNINDEGEQGA